MENRNGNSDIGELFRNKLENTEIDPGTAFRKRVMRRLELKEFIRFNPARFNVYYAAVLVAAGIAAILIFSSGGADKAENLMPAEKSAGITEAPVVTNPGEAVSGTINKGLREKDNPGEKRDRSDGLSVSGTDEAGDNVKVVLQKPKSQGGDSIIKSEIRKEILQGDLTAQADLQKKPSARFWLSATSGCVPLKVNFINRSLSYDSCVWIFGDGGYSDKKDTEWIFDVPGEYMITLKVFGKGLESMYSETVTVYPKPVARFETMPEKPIIPDDAISFINYSRDAVRYRWDFGDGQSSASFEPVHRYSRYKSYNVSLIAWSSNGCTDSVTVVNAFAESGCYITFPNAFIPNPDGPSGGNYSFKSDESARIFHPVTSGVSEYQLRIFSKIGILIFETHDINTGWDGYHKGQLCEPGVYVWKVRGLFRNGEPFVKMGDVTIIRN